MQLFVKTLAGNTLTLKAETSDTVDKIESKILDSVNVNPNEEKLVFGSEVLENNRVLSNYKIRNKSTLLAVRLFDCDQCFRENLAN